MNKFIQILKKLNVVKTFQRRKEQNLKLSNHSKFYEFDNYDGFDIFCLRISSSFFIFLIKING